jgi:RNA polymerase sigma factor (TIGR02999 family)
LAELPPSPSELTRVLAAARDGDSSAAEALLAMVYDELRGMARAQLGRLAPGQTLQATALVHEAWLRLSPQGALPFADRAHFFGAAARAMRNILVDQARKKHAARRGGGRPNVSLELAPPADVTPIVDVLAVDEALAKLEASDPRKVRLVELRVFAGLTMPEAADALGVSLSTAEREWRFARAWLATAIEGRDGGGA